MGFYVSYVTDGNVGPLTQEYLLLITDRLLKVYIYTSLLISCIHLQFIKLYNFLNSLKIVKTCQNFKIYKTLNLNPRQDNKSFPGFL